MRKIKNFLFIAFVLIFLGPFWTIGFVCGSLKELLLTGYTIGEMVIEELLKNLFRYSRNLSQ